MDTTKNLSVFTIEEQLAERLSKNANKKLFWWFNRKTRSDDSPYIQLTQKATLALDGMNEVLELAKPYKVLHITFFRLSEGKSYNDLFQWHSDNHNGTRKIMIYLSDVTKDTAPYEYLRHKQTHEPIVVPYQDPPKYSGSRVPREVIEKYFSEGYEPYFIVGKKGTALWFNNNIIHNKNFIKKGTRDVLVIEMQYE